MNLLVISMGLAMLWGTMFAAATASSMGQAASRPAQSQRKPALVRKSPKRPHPPRTTRHRPRSMHFVRRSSGRQVLRETLRFWRPRLRFVWRANREFWPRQVRSLWRTSREFWSPKLRFVLRASREFWFPRIERSYLPYVRERYRFFYLHYGRVWAQRYAYVVRLLGPAWRYPKWLFKGAWKVLPRSTQQSVQRVPAPVKIAFDRYLTWSLKHLHYTLRGGRKLPKTLRRQLFQLSRAMVYSQDAKLKRRLHRALHRLRAFTADPGMRSCYRVIALQSDVVNAFNTGCTNYLTSALAAKLTDLELTAVLAHELSHGDQGHAVKNMGLIAHAVGQHMYRLLSDEIEWFLTGKAGPTLERVLRRGNLISILRVYGKKAPAVELAADRGGAKILLRAGISPRYMIHALVKLHGRRPGTALKPDSRSYTNAVRHYPSLYRRVKALLPYCQHRR